MRRLLPSTTALVALASAVALAGSAAAAGPGTGAKTSTPIDTPGVHVLAAPNHTIKPLPPVSAGSWLIADADTGEVIAAKNAHTPLRPASTLKTLTAVTLLDELDPDDIYTPVYADIAAEGSKVGIVNGSRYTIEQLWYGLFLSSGNDTAHALARANGGMAKTVAEMNAEARRLQATDTVAKNPSGLDAEGQQSSAYDLALISRAGLQMPDFEKYCSTVSVKFPREGKKAKRKTFMVYNHNPLVIGGYKGAIGVKTGYTDLARRTFVGAAKQGDRTLIVTIMKYEGSTYRTAEALLDWGFKNATKTQPVGQLVDPLPAADVQAVARTQPDETSAASVQTSSGGSPTLWPFVLVGAALLALLGFGLRSKGRERDPLAAANKGLGGGTKPRGRGGPGRY